MKMYQKQERAKPGKESEMKKATKEKIEKAIKELNVTKKDMYSIAEMEAIAEKAWVNLIYVMEYLRYEW